MAHSLRAIRQRRHAAMDSVGARVTVEEPLLCRTLTHLLDLSRVPQQVRLHSNSASMECPMHSTSTRAPPCWMRCVSTWASPGRRRDATREHAGPARCSPMVSASFHAWPWQPSTTARRSRPSRGGPGTRAAPTASRVHSTRWLPCGYCTPGQICSTIGMMREIELGLSSAVSEDMAATEFGLTDAELKKRMSGNLCRCGAYVGICDAIQEFAASEAAR